MSVVAKHKKLVSGLRENAMMDGFRSVGGRPSLPTRAEYFLVDSRLPNDAFGTGYPQVIGDGNAPYQPLNALEYYPTQVLEDEFYISEFNTTLHEMGHGALHPTLIDEVESIIHLNATYIYNQVFGTSLDDAFKYSSQEFLTMDQISCVQETINHHCSCCMGLWRAV